MENNNFNNGYQPQNQDFQNNQPPQYDYTNQYTQNNDPMQYDYQNQYSQPQQNNGYNYQAPQQYNQPYYNQQYPNYNFPESQPKALAITSFIMGLSSMLFSCCAWYITIFVSIAGLVLGIVSIKKNEGLRGLAIAGIIISCVGVVFSIVMAILFVATISATPRYLY